MSQPRQIAITLHCGEDGCTLPWARVQNGCLVVQSRHNGMTHTNAIPIDKLAEICYNASREQILPAVDETLIQRGQ